MADRVATRDAFAGALVELAETDSRICALDADLSASTKTAKFRNRFPDRFFNVGVAEQNMIGIAAGLASCGRIPVASTFAVFATGRVYDQIRMTVAYPRLNVKIAATHGGVTVGEDGASHQALEDIALMRVLPGMTVLVPADGPSAAAAARLAVEHDGPVYIRLGRPAVPVVYDGEFEGRIGRSVTVAEGRDVAIIACGLMVEAALAAARQLQGEGISARVIDIVSVKPLDVDAVIAAADECGAIVTAEEHSVVGGLGSAVAEAVTSHRPVPVVRVGVDDQFGVSGKSGDLLKLYGLDADSVAGACREAISRR